MTFKPEISEVSIYNEALALLPSDPVQDPNEPGSIEARECRRVYKSEVAKLLERYHWNLATKRGTLAAITNDRDTEWTYAYAKPADMAYPVSLAPSSGGGYSGWYMSNYTYLLPSGQKMLMQSGGTLYSMIDGAAIEYTTFDITEADFTARFKELVVLWLAARICQPITKDSARTRELLAQAEFETQRAIASDMNRNQQTYGNKPTESELVRGVGIANYTGAWPYDPVAVPAYGVISSAHVSETGT